MSFPTRIEFEPIRVIPFGSIVAGYTPLGSPSSNPLRLIELLNNTDETVVFSFDGVTDQIFISAGFGQRLLSNDLAGRNEDALYVEGTQLFIKFLSTPPTTGTAEVVMAFTE